MKKLIDNTLVSARSYYYLLDWNDRDNKIFMSDTFGKQKLMELNKTEYSILFEHVTKLELKNITK